MAGDSPQLTGPDLARGIEVSQLRDGAMIAGHAFGQPVLLARRGEEYFATGSQCTHYSGPLAEGLFIGETVRCPWHHACFDLRTGEAIRAPALRPLARYAVERRGETVVVTREITEPPPARTPSRSPKSVVILGAGAAADAAADVLRREGYTGPVTMIGAEPDAPYDRPNLSKDYLAGNAPEEWIPLRPPSFYKDANIRLALGSAAASIDLQGRTIRLESGEAIPFDALLIATGASPVMLPDKITNGRVRYLRSLADSRALVAAAVTAKQAVVIGASFIGLETAAALRQRGLAVHVVAPEPRPLERILGAAIGDYIRERHLAAGIVFHLERTVASVAEGSVTLDDGTRVDADLVVAGVGVRPNDAIAKAAGLTVENGIVVNELLETSVPSVYAAGDVARYPDARTGASVRVEHWVVAQRMGQTAARNILGRRERYDAVPFFWSAHPEAQVSYVGHATQWDSIDVDGDLASGDATVTYRSKGKTLAVATVGRDRASLESELAMERTITQRGTS